MVVKGDDRQVELALTMAKTEPHRRPFNYARIDNKYGFLSNEEKREFERLFDESRPNDGSC